MVCLVAGRWWDGWMDRWMKGREDRWVGKWWTDGEVHACKDGEIWFRDLSKYKEVNTFMCVKKKSKTPRDKSLKLLLLPGHVNPLTVFTRVSASALKKFSAPQMRPLFKNWTRQRNLFF